MGIKMYYKLNVMSIYNRLSGAIIRHKRSKLRNSQVSISTMACDVVMLKKLCVNQPVALPDSHSSAPVLPPPKSKPLPPNNNNNNQPLRSSFQHQLDSESESRLQLNSQKDRSCGRGPTDFPSLLAQSEDGKGLPISMTTNTAYKEISSEDLDSSSRDQKQPCDGDKEKRQDRNERMSSYDYTILPGRSSLNSMVA